MDKLKIDFTKHAEDMLKERNLEKKLIEETVFDPDWKEEKEEDIWHAFRRVGNKVLRVIVKGKEGSYKVITMYYDRRIKDEAQSGYGK
ncbi:MAG: DUF4258 domain-containing protein [Methanosarcinales archaeon]|uniref:DUF4258 domain-containing protein n=1 Tax=Candidatus Ethanoperedens thermophilum TaxID=2766897 RepID=A0A848DAT7_9EURY|nr:DUF4258 domain-containing protein [Candidatus Ethanoperedens thermophilum]